MDGCNCELSVAGSTTAYCHTSYSTTSHSIFSSSNNHSLHDLTTFALTVLLLIINPDAFTIEEIRFYMKFHVWGNESRQRNKLSLHAIGQYYCKFFAATCAVFMHLLAICNFACYLLHCQIWIAKKNRERALMTIYFLEVENYGLSSPHG